MARKVFISYQHQDLMKAKGFNLLRWNKNVDLSFVGRHLLDPVDSTNESYIRGKVKEQLTGSSVTVVLIGKETCNSEWVKWEIEKSLEKDRPNGILAIRINDDAALPAGCPVGSALDAAAAEIIDWDPHKFDAAIERAALAARRVQSISSVASRASTNIGSCSR